MPNAYSLKFKTTLNRHLEAEGGYANVAGDLGGETYKGIARRYHGGWLGWARIDAAKRQPNFSDFSVVLETNGELQSDVQAFYHEKFWQPMQLESVAKQEVANEMFDIGAGPNGMSIAIKIAQGALILLGKNIDLDGKIGSKTVEALNGYPHSADLVKLMNGLQLTAMLVGSANIDEFVNMIRDLKHLLQRFLRGWLKRITI